MEPTGLHSSNESSPSLDDPDYSAYSDSDDDDDPEPNDEDRLGRESSTKSKKALGYVPFTDEEREEMKKFYGKMRHKCDTESQVWDMFSKLVS